MKRNLGLSRPKFILTNRQRRLMVEGLEPRAMLVTGPGVPFVDVDNDAIYNAGAGDVLLPTELNDGVFDTDVAEGAYATVVQGAGLAIDGAAIAVTGHIRYKADGNLVVNTNLTGRNVELKSRFGSVLLDDPTVSGRNVDIDAAIDFIATGDVILATGDIEIEARGDVVLDGSDVEAGNELEIKSKTGSVTANSAILGAPSKEVVIQARTFIEADNSLITATKSIEITAVQGSVHAHGSSINASHSKSTVEIKAGDDVDLSELGDDPAIPSFVQAGKEIEIKARDDIFATGAFITATGSEIVLTAGGDIVAPGVTVTANGKGEIELEAGGLIDLSGLASLLARGGTVEVEARGGIDLTEATVRALKEIIIKSRTGDVVLVLASVGITGGRKGNIEVKGSTIDVEDAVLVAPGKIKLKGTVTGTPDVFDENGTLP